MVLVLSFVLGLCLAVAVWVGLLLGSPAGIKAIRYWFYSLLLFGYTRNMADTEMEVSWYGLKGGEHCLRYATREYTAKLVGGFMSEDMMKLCRDMPTSIHGQTLFTDFCQDLGFGRGIWGYWIVNFEESDCETKWGDFVDLGCTDLAEAGPGDHLRRFESQLENLQAGSVWQIMCATTPADIDGHHFGGPNRCHSSPALGTYGVWDLTDRSCGVD